MQAMSISMKTDMETEDDYVYYSSDDVDVCTDASAAMNIGPWTKKELTTLRVNVIRYCLNENIMDPRSAFDTTSHIDISLLKAAAATGVNRSNREIWLKCVAVFARDCVKSGMFTDDEDEWLLSLLRHHGPQYEFISKIMHRSVTAVRIRCLLLTENKPALGWWTCEELSRLRDVVQQHSVMGSSQLSVFSAASSLKWDVIASEIGLNRSADQCQRRWFDIVDISPPSRLKHSWKSKDYFACLDTFDAMAWTNVSDVDMDVLRAQPELCCWSLSDIETNVKKLLQIGVANSVKNATWDEMSQCMVDWASQRLESEWLKPCPWQKQKEKDDALRRKGEEEIKLFKQQKRDLVLKKRQAIEQEKKKEAQKVYNLKFISKEYISSSSDDDSEGVTAIC